MEKTYIYKPAGVCSREMHILIDDGKIVGFEVVGGCNGNLKGIGRLIEGLEVDEVIKRLSGLDCRGRGTSCPDQLAQALTKIRENKLQPLK